MSTNTIEGALSCRIRRIDTDHASTVDEERRKARQLSPVPLSDAFLAEKPNKEKQNKTP
jgi:3-phenylpropionate/cinnamic acid dioxygenase small subunit